MLRLAWRLCVLQFVIVVLAMVAVAYRFFDGNISYIHDSSVAIVASATKLTDRGPLFQGSEALAELRRDYPAAWAVAVDDQGRYAHLGTVPAPFEALAAHLGSLGASEVHPTRGTDGLGMRTVVQTRDGHALHLMLGGVPTSGYFKVILVVVRGLSPFFVWPLLFLTVIAVPWVIVRATAGVRRIAENAASLDMAEDGAKLDERAVPHEVQPLVHAFNGAMERVREGYQARDRFLRDASHELRMPIAIMAARLEAMPPAPIRNQLITEVARLANIAEQLLDLERLRTPQPGLETLDLVDVVKEATSDMAPLIVARGYELSFDGPDEPVMVTGHASSLARVATNLLQNAIVHGGGTGLIQVTVGANGWFEVRDQGPGIPAEEKLRIFRPFYRSQAVVGEGHGLGLHLSQEIVARHGGRIRVADAPGGGANFRVVLKPGK